MDARATLTCPYCGVKVNCTVDCRFFRESVVVRCEPVVGGCDRDFVLDFWAKFETRIRQITGEQ